MPEKTDEQCMVQYQQGDMEAFKELYFRYSKRVYAYFRKRRAGSEEELLQMAFLKMHENRHLFDASYKFAPWLFTLAHNVLIDYVRKEKRNPIGEKTATIFDENSHLMTTTDEETERSSVNLTAAIGSLKKEEQQLIALRFEKALSYEEIAVAIDLPPVTARKRISRILERLRKILG